eukprot:NODE_2372_length_711_cov_6.805136_g1924_i0.p5 GENE.NODE_2372_length_711_cov_6.805136_g1924_i0~~NODE_2372_length_711_cov_6.805136_g1924_i0.p5  ORF type:complete len:50 (+),score=4.60 NODE_2372_length_711_cov_6.805136_g1924_i0:303-452(+)
MFPEVCVYVSFVFFVYFPASFLDDSDIGVCRFLSEFGLVFCVVVFSFQT